MAALASAQVDIALAVAEMLAAPDALVANDRAAQENNLLDAGLRLYDLALGLICSAPVALHDMATRALLRNDLDLLKYGNDAIFDDIAWAHRAYLEGGLKEVEAGVAASEEGYLLSGFRKIDEGARKLELPAEREAGKELIFKGNVDLLRHEQQKTLQPLFERLTDMGKLMVSLGGMLDFDGMGTYGMGAASSFGLYFGLAAITRQRCLSRFEDRWEWLDKDALPVWQQIDASFREGSPLHRRLVALAGREQTVWQQASALMNTLYPALGLRLQPAALVAA
jgi:hypothetical protein